MSLAPGETGTAEGHWRLAGRFQEVSVGASVVNRVHAVACVAPRAVQVAQVAAPGVLSSVGLESIDPDVLHQVAALLGPPGCGVMIAEVRHQPEREPPPTVAVWPQRAIRCLLLNEVPSTDC